MVDETSKSKIGLNLFAMHTLLKDLAPINTFL